jgi:hypothetical protein
MSFQQSEALRSSVSLAAAGIFCGIGYVGAQKWKAENVAVGTPYICVGLRLLGIVFASGDNGMKFRCCGSVVEMGSEVSPGTRAMSRTLAMRFSVEPTGVSLLFLHRGIGSKQQTHSLQRRSSSRFCRRGCVAGSEGLLA